MKNMLGAIILSLSAIGFTAIASTTVSAGTGVISTTASTDAGFRCKSKIIKAVGRGWSKGTAKTVARMGWRIRVTSKYSPVYAYWRHSKDKTFSCKSILLSSINLVLY